MNSLLLLAAFAAAYGDDPLKAACWDDVQRLCPGTRNPGMCIEQNWDAVSEGCRDVKLELKKKWQGKDGIHKPNPCAEDLKRLCHDAEDKGWCLRDNLDQLSEECRAHKTKKKPLKKG